MLTTLGPPSELLCIVCQVARLEGWYKQRDNKMYPAWAYVFPTTILRLPYSLLVATLWCCIVYYPVGLAPEPARHALHPQLRSLQPRPLLGLQCAQQPVSSKAFLARHL